MRPRRSTRTAGGSRGGGGGDGVSESGNSPCQPAGDMDESIVLDTKTLLEMLGPSSSPDAGEEDAEEQDGEGGEENDLVMDLDDRFKHADLKRKFGESVLMMSGGGVLHDDTGGGSGANNSSGDGSAKSRDSSSSSSSGVVGSLPEAGVAAAPRPGHVKTVLRVRPVEPSAGQLSLRAMDSKTVMTNNPSARTRAGARVFEYGRVMDETALQESVFDETAKPLVEGLLQGSGKNGLVIAYGATNAGKTHTIMGARGEDDGILPRTLAGVYERMMQGANGGDPDKPSPGGGGGGAGGDEPFRVNFRVVEIYMDKAYDLLRDEKERGPALSFREFQGDDRMEGLSNHYPEDLPAALDLVRQARSKAPVSATALNPFSSRGHTVWMIEVVRGGGRGAVAVVDGRAAVAGRGSGFGAVQRTANSRNPMLWIVDLAGSERTERSMSNHREAFNINSDITNVFRCFKMVEAGCLHVPFRTRTLTRMLKNVLVRGADSVDPRMSCVMVVNVNPAASEYGETQKVLTNALISMKARIGDRPPRTGGGSEPAMYDLNGHFIGKRQKISGGGAAAAVVAGGGGGAADGASLRVASVSGKGTEGQLALVGRSRRGSAAVGAQRVTMSWEEQAIVINEQGRNVARLEEEVTQLQDQLGEMQEDVWDQAQEEMIPQIEDLEKALADSRARESGLRLKLDRLDPVGANAKAAVAQSARKQAARQTETVNTLLSQNVQEAEDETRREAEKRVRAEDALEVAVAERDAAAARAAEALDVQAKSEAAVREERSEGKAARLEAELTQLKAVVAAESGRAADLEAKNDGLEDKLRVALEEIGRLQDAVALAEAEINTVQMDMSTSSASACMLPEDEQPHQRFQSDRESGDPFFVSPIVKTKRGTALTARKKRISSLSSSSGGGSGGGGGSSTNDEPAARRTRASQACPTRSSSARGTSFGRGEGGGQAGARASLRSSLSVQDGGCNEGGGGGGGGGGGNDDNDDDTSESSRSRVDEASLGSLEMVVGDGGDGDGRDASRESGSLSGEEEEEGNGKEEEEEAEEEEEEKTDKEREGRKAQKGKKEGEEVQKVEKEEGGALSAAGDAAGDSKAAEEKDGDGGETGRDDGRVKWRGLKSSRLRLRARKPLGSLEQLDGNAGGTTVAAAEGKGGKRRKRAASADDCGGADEEEEKAGREKQVEEEEVKGRKARSREETRQCTAAREKSMLSRPSPEVVTLTKEQAEVRDRGNRLVKARRSCRRRGQR